MKHILFLTLFACAIALGLASCSDTSVNVNSSNSANRPANTGNTANTANSGNTGSSFGNAANTVANAVSSATTSAPESFMKDAAQGGMAEVEMGKLASTKGQNSEVKKFGAMMVTDHTKANTELKALAASKKIELPGDIGSHKSTMDKLNGLTGADFDKQYVDDMVSDHETDVAAFQKQADNATDPEVKAFAAKTLPTLKHHLEVIKALQTKMNNAK